MAVKAVLRGVLTVPGDKSISHRALIFSALSRGTNKIYQLSPAEDCQSSLRCLTSLGLKFTRMASGNSSSGLSLKVDSPGLAGLSAPEETLDAGNSGTTIRLLSGLLAGRSFESRLDGDESLRGRPMARVLDHLKSMGAAISFDTNEGRAPFVVKGKRLEGRHFDLKVASAQVETALLLAGLQADGKTSVKLPSIARDHTMRMFTHIGVPFTREADGSTAVTALDKPVPEFEIHVPGDISSAAFFMVAAACLEGSDVTLNNVGISTGRTLVIDILKRMGSNLTVMNEREVCGEKVADIKIVGGKRLVGTTIEAEEIAQGVDEIPILALAGAVCDGLFTVKGAAELRHKESDRLALIAKNFSSAGCDIEEFEDGFTIKGKKSTEGGSTWATALDHRLAMAGQIASLVFDKKLELEETASAAVSYPDFTADLHSLLK